jgi:RNA-directed DNA polymerase
MELVAGRLEDEADLRIGDEVEPDLVRRARRSAGDRTCKAPVDCTVQVAAQDAFDLGMARDDFGKSRGIVEAVIVHVGDARREWRVMPEERKFLGFSISNDGSERRIAPKALDKFKTQIRDTTRRTRGISLPQLIEELTPYLIGWRGYFGFCQTPRVLTNLEAWIRRRIRSYLWRQWQNGHNRFNELRRRGVPKFNAAVAAGSPTGFWRMSGHPAVQQALRNHYFDSLGLPRLHVSAQA